MVKPVHEWLSWALVAGAILHTAAHWKSFTNYFTKRYALAIISIGALVAVASFTAPIKGGRGNPFMKAGKAVASSSVETVAPIVHLTPGQAVEKLQNKGFNVASPSLSIRAIAADNRKKEMEVLAVLFD